MSASYSLESQTHSAQTLYSHLLAENEARTDRECNAVSAPSVCLTHTCKQAAPEEKRLMTCVTGAVLYLRVLSL